MKQWKCTCYFTTKCYLDKLAVHCISTQTHDLHVSRTEVYAAILSKQAEIGGETRRYWLSRSVVYHTLLLKFADLWHPFQKLLL